MANDLVPSSSAFSQLQSMSSMPWLRQLIMLIGLAGSIAVGVAVVLWSQTPSYQVLYGGLADKDQAQVAEELQKSNIPYKIDTATGAIMVPGQNIQDARLKLAAQGLPRGTNGGFDSMDEKATFGSSQFMEIARYQHAQEGELARSIMTINNVQSARVHLALPRQSAFVRNRQPPTASVLVNLYQGRNLDDGQIAAIVHLVASSVSNLDPSRVTVVDQKGRLLTGRENQQEFELTTNQFDYTHRLEDSYIQRIENLLTPIIGPGGVRAQVAADVDFTVTEQTQESFKPDPTALRSEQTAEERTLPGAGVAGIPGALSNQPPGAVSVPETTAKVAAPDKSGKKLADATATSAADIAAALANTSKRATRNYELDKTISHTKAVPGKVRRLSVAVLVDNMQVLNEDGEVERKPLTPEEVTMVTGIVKEVIGFSTERGDTVQVINKPFSMPAAEAPLPEPKWFEKPWLWDVGKQALAGILVLLLIFVVLRPMLRNIASMPIPTGANTSVAVSGGSAAPQALQQVGGPANYDASLTTAKSLAAQDPKRVAQVVKNWVANDA